MGIGSTELARRKSVFDFVRSDQRKMIKVLSLERLPPEAPEWAFYVGAVLLAVGVFGTMWALIKIFK